MPLEPLTITDAAPLIKSGELTPGDLLEQCLRRVDVYEPAVKAWVYLDRERARQEAARFTDEIKNGQYRGPLHGIPLGIKDIIDVYDMPTGCGSKLWANSYARKDATCVARLRQAGAVIMGKTVTTPYAYLDPPVTRNPWNLERTPGGSSSGSAAAVACAMCLGALGTQTGGSLTRPASYCGVCSLKPTYGRVSVDGVLPLAPSLDHVGVMARCVRDLAVLYVGICGLESHIGSPIEEIDSQINRPRTNALFFDLLDNSPDYSIDFEIFSLFGSAKLELSFGPNDLETIFEGRKLPTEFPNILSSQKCIIAKEVANVHGTRFRREQYYYPPKIATLIAEGIEITEATYKRSIKLQQKLKASVNQSFTGHHFITPAVADRAPDLSSTGNPVMNSPWSYLGMPTVSFPFTTFQDGMPLSIQTIGWLHGESRLLAAAAWLEHAAIFVYKLPPVP